MPFPLTSLAASYLLDVELRSQATQAQFFRARAVVGAVIRPLVFQPAFEPAGGNLVALFVEPGAVHLVFADEVHPVEPIDREYRVLRKERLYGRTRDIESAEVTPSGELYFPGSASGLANLYETSNHVYATEPYEGAVFSNTWNHLLSARSSLLIKARGGYRQAPVPVIEGGRDAAERY